jgi:hypothetical protein
LLAALALALVDMILPIKTIKLWWAGAKGSSWF